MYELQVYKNKKYRTIYTGKMSGIYKRLPSIFSKFRVRKNGEPVTLPGV